MTAHFIAAENGSQTIRQNMETVSSPSVTWLLMDALSWTESHSLVPSHQSRGWCDRVAAGSAARSIYSVSLKQ